MAVAYPPQVDAESVERRFATLAESWRSETGLYSSTTTRTMHPAYQQVIGLGPAAVPFLLRELDQEPDQWFWALKAITGEDPVSESHRGRLQEMARDWIAWGREKGYSW